MKQPHPWRTRRSRTLFWDPCLSRIAFWQFVGISCLVVTSAWVSMSLGLPSQASAFSPPLGLVFGFLLIHASARRLHDAGRSGWWLLLAFTLVGLLPLTVWLLRPSQYVQNPYRRNTRTVTPEQRALASVLAKHRHPPAARRTAHVCFL